MIPSKDEVKPCAPLLPIPVSITNELSGEPGKYQTKHHLNRNTIGYAVKF